MHLLVLFLSINVKSLSTMAGILGPFRVATSIVGVEKGFVQAILRLLKLKIRLLQY